MSLKFDDVCCLSFINVVFRYLFIRIISQNRVFFSRSKLRGSYSKFKLNRLFSKRYVWLMIFLQRDSNRQELSLSVFDSFYGYAIINISWNRKVKMFAITFHASSIPNFTESSLSVFFIKKVSIEKDIIITVYIEIFRINSKGKINMVIFVILSFWLKSCGDNWVTLFDIFLDPLKIIFVLRLRL